MIFINSSRVAMKKILLCLLLVSQVNQNLYMMHSSDDHTSKFEDEKDNNGWKSPIGLGILLGINFMYWVQLRLINRKANEINNRWNLFTDNPSTLEQRDFVETMKELEEQHGKNFRKLLRADLKRVNELIYQFEGREFFSDPLGSFTDNNYRIRLSYYFKLHYLYMTIPAFWNWGFCSTLEKLHALKDRLELIEEIAFPQI